MPFALFHGRFGLPIPYKVNLSSAVGRAIRVPHPIPDPTPEEVEAVVTEYKREVTRIYYAYRPADCDRDLVLLDEFPW